MTGSRIRQPGQPVTDDHQDVADASVLQLGENVQPVFGALAAVPGPQPEDVAVTFARHGQGNVDGSSARGKARDHSTARVAERLVRKGLRPDDQRVEADTDCVAHSYGQVHDFFRAHPCTALFRALVQVHDDHGNLALLAIAWVDMPDRWQARRLQQLMDRPGTGNITELSREHGGQRFSGDCYRSSLDGDTVLNVQAEPVGRARAALSLAQLVVDATA